MVVDVFGHPADWDAIEALANRHGLKVIDHYVARPWEPNTAAR